MTRKLSPVRVTAAAVLAAVSGTAGCTGSTPPPRPGSASTVRFAVDGQPPAGASPAVVTGLLRRAWTATAAARTAVLATRTMTRVVVAGGPVEVLTVIGTGPAVFATAAVDLQLRATPDLRLRWRFLGGVLYATTPTTPAAPTAAGGWSRTDLDDPAGYSAGTPLPPNPVALLRDLSRSVTSAVPAGSAVLGGVRVTRYAATAELPAAAAAAPAGAARLVLRHLEAVTGTDHLFVQEWVDGAGRIRQFSYTDQAFTAASSPSPDDGPAVGAATLATTTATLTLTHFGTPAAVTAPPVNSPGP